MSRQEKSDADAGAGAVDRAEVAGKEAQAQLPADAAEWSGNWFRLRADYGEGLGMIPAGTHVRVLGVHPPGTPGIGAAMEDSPLVQWIYQGASGRWVPRNTHFTADTFRQLVEPADEPEQWREWIAQQEG